MKVFPVESFEDLNKKFKQFRINCYIAVFFIFALIFILFVAFIQIRNRVDKLEVILLDYESIQIEMEENKSNESSKRQHKQHTNKYD